MKGLLLKDLYSLRKYLRSVMLILALYALMTFLMDSPVFLGGMIVIMSAMIAVTSFSFDHVAGWDVYALSLPVSRRDVVAGKYVLAFIFTLGGTVLAVIVSLQYNAFRHTGSVTETLATSYGMFAVGMVFVAVLLPLLFKFGAEKARLFIIAVFAVPTAAFVALSTIADFKMPDEQTIARILALSPLILIVVGAISYAASCAIYRSKEV